MNQNSIISKFIEKCGPLDPKPHLHYVQGGVKGHFGLTTEPGEVLQLWRNRFFKEHQKYPNIKISSTSDILPNIHFEYDGWSVDFDNRDLLSAMRLLQNAPFSKIQIVNSTEPLPMIFFRQDVTLYILLAPIMLQIPKQTEAQKELKKYKFSTRWIAPLPDTTFWIVEVTSGMIAKCKKCGNEKDIEEWKKLRDSYHPECYCSCETYGDECGCRKKREGQRYDRIRRVYTESEQRDFQQMNDYVEAYWKSTVNTDPTEYLYWHDREIKYKGYPYWLRQ